MTMLCSPEAVRRASTAISPAAPSLALAAETARTFVPVRSCARTSITAGRRQPSLSVARSVCATSVPFTETAYTLSALMARVAAVIPSARSTECRNQRVPSGTLLAGSPSGYQIQELFSSEGASVRAGGADTQAADHSAGSMRPVSHHEGALQPDSPPAVSHTRTDQK